MCHNLVYCSCVWSPYYNVHNQAIERVQHKLLRYIYFKENYNLDDINYITVENDLGISTLQIRRLHRDITMFYKLLHFNSSCPSLLNKRKTFMLLYDKQGKIIPSLRLLIEPTMATTLLQPGQLDLPTNTRTAWTALLMAELLNRS